ncbi:MAG: hypothetical protein JWO05_3733 [Gemmatimonadetes bacterium]|nr:hypothetical protein [Gemmatimonadota bacterium]
MIEINLLPGAKKKVRRSGGAGFNPRAAFAKVSERVKDKYLASGVGAGIVGIGAVAFMFLTAHSKQVGLETRQDKAVKDSTQYATLLADRAQWEARRDTVVRQLNIIRAIDDDRFIWPHIMAAASENLPPYTWLTSITYGGTPQGTVNVLAAPKPPAPAAVAPGDTAAAAAAAAAAAKAPPKKKKDSGVIPLDTIHVRILGRTVDMQALTRYMRDLEASPFLGSIQLTKTEPAVDGGRDVTQFELEAVYTRPTPAEVKRVPVALSVK